MSNDQTVVTIWLLLTVGIIGTIVGSFLNVVIARVPEKRSIVRPRSRCIQCDSEISSGDNIPIVSWILLRGRCRHCSARISIQYPVIEALTGIMWIVITGWALVTAPEDSLVNPLLPLLITVASALIVLFAIDVRWYKLPNEIVYFLYPTTIVGLLIALALGGDWSEFPNLAVSALGGAALWVGVIGGLWLATRGRAMGLGDVKLAPILGVILGWGSLSSAAIGLLAAFVLGAGVGLFLIITGRAGARAKIAFGPYLILGFFFGLIFGSSVWDSYLGIIGLSR